MAKIKINFSGVEQANARLTRLIQELEQIESELSYLQRRVDWDIQSRRGIAQQLRACKNLAGIIQAKAKSVGQVAQSGVDQYRQVDARLSQNVPENNF